MDIPRVLSALTVLALTAGLGAGGSQESPRLRGPYLGQEPPGMIPRAFAPGIMAAGDDEGSSGFARKGGVFLFQRFRERRCHTFISRLVNGFWTAPELVPFWETLAQNGDFVISSDDRTMLYQVRSESGPASDIWRAEITDMGWGERAPLPPPVNTQFFESFASDTAAGDIYFFSGRPGGKGRFDLYMCPFEAGNYGDAVNLRSLNTEADEWDPFVSPDGSYLLFCSTRPGGFGRDDIYIAFRGKDGEWGQPVNMGEEVNSSGSENRPFVTRDGAYFFFTSTRNGSRATFWVKAQYIDRFRKQ